VTTERVSLSPLKSSEPAGGFFSLALLSRAHLSRALRLFALGLLLFVVACQRPYRVGDYVLVEWGDEKQLYPAYIIGARGDARFRVHFDGYPARWDEDVTLDRIKGFARERVFPPPPRHVRAVQSKEEKSDVASRLSRFKVGDKVRVRFRGSFYRATVLEVESAGRLKVHYEGHESAWDEVVDIGRVEIAP